MHFSRWLLPPCAALVLVIAPWWGGGCASDKYGPPATAWNDDHHSGQRAPDAVAASSSAAGPKKSAAELAAGKSSASSCMENAEKVGGDPGLALVRECMHRSDFLDLARAVKEPWLPKMRTSAQLQARVVEVIARRGGFLERDAVLLRRGKLPMITLDDAVNTSPKLGTLVIARGTVEKVASEKWGKGQGLVAHVAETSWLSSDGAQVDGEAPSMADVELATPQRTGRMFYVRVENKDQLKRSQDVVVLMTLEGPRSGKDAEGEDAATVIGILVAASDAAGQLRE